MTIGVFDLGRRLFLVARRPGSTLAIFGLSLSVVAVTVFLADLYSRHRAAIAIAEHSAQSFAEVLAEHTARTFETVDRALLETERIRRDAIAGRYSTAEEVSEALRHVQQASPFLLAIGWTDAAGNLQQCSCDELGQPPNVGNLLHFTAQRDAPNLGLFVSPPFRSPASGRWIAAVSRRLNNADGSFGGIVAAPIDQSYFTSVYRSTRPGPNDIVLLLSRQGLVIAREPMIEGAIGRSFLGMPLLREHLPQAEAGSYEILSPIDSRERIAGYKAVPGLPLVVLVAYDRAEVLQPWYRHLRTFGLLVAGMVALILAGTWLLLRMEARADAARQEAERANRAKSDFLAGMSHEMRTPMTSVIGMTDLLLESNLTNQQRRHATLLRDAGRTLLSIIDDLLDVSKIEAGKLELTRVSLSPSAIAEGALSVVRPSAAAKGLELHYELASDVPASIEGDPTRLHQILLNLLSNAIKFTDRGSVVLRTTRVRGAETEQLRFEVADTGIGVDLAEQHRLFQRFSQLGRNTARQSGGTGLGLAISRHLVEAMGGTIGVNSRIGAGSTFWFTLPCVETRSRVERVGTGKGGPVEDTGSRARILVAEDYELIQELIEAMLTDAGHEVVLAHNGIEAIAALQAGDFDLVLMDVQMPGLDGIAATRRIRAMSDRIRGIPIIMLTAYATSEDVEMCRAAGASEHLSKPIDREKLLRLVAKWSGRGHA
jgi:two-component system, sensor histidine kinase